MADAIICDATVWLYLGLLSQVDLLNRLYDRVITTETVCRELDAGRLNRQNILDPRHLPWVTLVEAEAQSIAALPENRLGPGEQSILAYALDHHIPIVGLDDRQAREFAGRLGLHVIGTVGLLLKARRDGLLMSLRPLLTQLRQEGFYLSESLEEFALRQANEA